MSGTIEFSEDFEGGSVGTVISAANTGFASKHQGGGYTNNITFASTAASGSQSAALNDTNGTGSVYMQHDFSATQTDVYMRLAVFLPTNWNDLDGSSQPIGGGAVLGILKSGGGGTTYILLSNVATIHTASITQSTVNTLPLNQWFLIEWHVSSSAGTMTLRLYGDLYGSPIETVSSSYGGGTINSAQVGLVTPQGGDGGTTYWLDAYADAFDDWVGPLVMPGMNTAAFPWMRA